MHATFRHLHPQVMMGEETYKRLPLERLWDKHLVLHVGEYAMHGCATPASLYYAVSRSLQGRLGLLPQVQSLMGQEVSPIACGAGAIEDGPDYKQAQGSRGARYYTY